MSVPSPFPTQAELKKPVCVFCGSSPGKLPLFTNASVAVGQALAKNGIPLVYGGGRRGIMGVVSQSCLKAGGYVHGIVPAALTERASEHTPAPGTPAPSSSGKSKEGQGEDVLSEEQGEKFTTDVVGSMHERKLKMAKISQGGFIVLPGGYGTFEEALEMITWNQLGIHRLPILILNIGNFYTHLYNQFLSSVEAGFIAPSNLSLLKLVNLEGGEGANGDESRAEEWGQAAIKALDEWELAAESGYGLDWEVKEKRSASTSKMRPEAIFTTLRYTSPTSTPTLPVQKELLPLLNLHYERLREAFDHFSRKFGNNRWGIWPGEERIWDELTESIESAERSKSGDYRVRVVIHPGGRVDVQCVSAPKDAGPFTFLPSFTLPSTRRPVILDPEDTLINSQSQSDPSDEVDLRLYKTLNREMYDTAYERGGRLVNPSIHPEVILHTPTHLLETTTSNLAILLSSPNSHPNKWITPKLSGESPFLNGVMRRYLLRKGVIEEGEVTVEMIRQIRKNGGRIIGFNGLRGVWEGELI
ncbi:hypothetical protein I302_104989 [Kwoniella bestiolae CBS 10118]|uniref:Lysine decarboxylase n=1 Tax=Kwoniella bestiolae CBS 10118 TaxID=1296100 RepID=A0A1B9FR73_9TREE|nr:lysine decarboxylase [Kwoniella bestiolae CBS 10118]OCF21267.1 lysine decarboxylase [Kwoniella bestiolae CBS 10118]